MNVTTSAITGLGLGLYLSFAQATHPGWRGQLPSHPGIALRLDLGWHVVLASVSGQLPPCGAAAGCTSSFVAKAEGFAGTARKAQRAHA